MENINKALEEDYKPALLEALNRPLLFEGISPPKAPIKKPWHLRMKQRLASKAYRMRLRLASKIAGFDVEDGGYY